MGQLEALAHAEQVDGVVAHHVTTAQPVHGHLVVGARAHVAAAPVDLAQVGARRARRFSQAFGGTGGRIDLLSVMNLRDFDVVAEPQPFYGLLDQLGQNLDPQAHVGRPHHRHGERGLVERLLGRVVDVGGAADHRDFLARRHCQQRRHRRSRREIDHHVGAQQTGSNVGGGDDAQLADAGQLAHVTTEARIGIGANAADDFQVCGRERQTHDGRAHAPGGAENGKLHWASYVFIKWARLALQPSVASTMGNRTLALIMPFMAKPALIGAGLGSLKNAR